MSLELGQDPSLRDLDRSGATVDELILAVPADGWGARTPCRDWDIRELVNHIVSGALILTSAATGETAPDWTSDKVGDDPLGAYRRATSAFREAMAAPDALTTSFDSVLGHEPGSALVRMRISEHLAHGWDLARALGRPTDFTPDLAEQVLDFWVAGLGDVPRDGMPFDEASAPAPDATAADRLAAYLGRRV